MVAYDVGFGGSLQHQAIEQEQPREEEALTEDAVRSCPCRETGGKCQTEGGNRGIDSSLTISSRRMGG